MSERERELAEQLAQAEHDGERFCRRIADLEAERAKVVTIIMGNGQCGNLPPYIDGIVRDLNELRLIVEKLPKTADGVPVVPGNAVWVSLTLSILQCDDWIQPVPDGTSQEWQLQWGLGYSTSVSNCFSTRKAAESADRDKQPQQQKDHPKCPES